MEEIKLTMIQEVLKGQSQLKNNNASPKAHNVSPKTNIKIFGILEYINTAKAVDRPPKNRHNFLFK